LAVGGVYYYNTSNIFAESAIGRRAEADDMDDPAHRLATEAYPPSPDYQQAEAEPSTIEAITERKRQVKAAAEAEQQNLARSQAVSAEEDSEPPRTPQEYEDEAGQQGAFNPETGEINWDCPCLGGMAHGPCGENFREAFSCFVFSKEEPKGMDCIDKFKYVS
jgi:intermembrane space import and assembly protein 40